jgi:hypothetical protein
MNDITQEGSRGPRLELIAVLNAESNGWPNLSSVLVVVHSRSVNFRRRCLCKIVANSKAAAFFRFLSRGKKSVGVGSLLLSA